MERPEAVMACVAEMRKMPRFQSSPDSQKTKAATLAFELLHEDAKEHLPMGCSSDDLKHYAKAATKRVHDKLTGEYAGESGAAEFEQVNGFPLLLILGLLPTLWSWFKMLKEWMGW